MANENDCTVGFLAKADELSKVLSALTSFNCWWKNFRRKDPRNLYLEEQLTKMGKAKFVQEDKSEDRLKVSRSVTLRLRDDVLL